MNHCNNHTLTYDTQHTLRTVIRKLQGAVGTGGGGGGSEKYTVQLTLYVNYFLEFNRIKSHIYIVIKLSLTSSPILN